ncbi:hypothetical protein [Nannocystis punicea]|uniref:Uncharacterized protein n=1 Tax=Nannocystis punicea TaxID=2995304 RepID=A0ABY7H6W3_9BACT|nr:hypothetical protein [Nannocystis poenicansa]WAS95006.1 hypothetical protein O0S08_02495 [Nannocystis poenicansa]
MRWFLGLVGFVAVLQIVLAFLLIVNALWTVAFDSAAEVSCAVTLALVLGSAGHYARRGTIVPPRPLLSLTAAVLAAPMLAVALGSPPVADGGPERLALESGFVLFQMVGLWIFGGVLFGGPFARAALALEPDRELQHEVRVRVDSRLVE